ncbi:MAG: 23S rRNA-intervening sequence protein [Candidatus Udaeobacter sp.]|nr:MAG: 23S rRNA-intervening sequence protein [Candidatus Udaeobacter sp.]
MRDYTKIEAWRLADDLTVAFTNCTVFSQREIYGLTSQLRRAAYSVPANIVEGASERARKITFTFFICARLAIRDSIFHSPRGTRLLVVRGADALQQQTKATFACLHGLIRAVEKEAENSAKWSQP